MLRRKINPESLPDGVHCEERGERGWYFWRRDFATSDRIEAFIANVPGGFEVRGRGMNEFRPEFLAAYRSAIRKVVMQTVPEWQAQLQKQIDDLPAEKRELATEVQRLGIRLISLRHANVRDDKAIAEAQAELEKAAERLEAL